MSNSFSEIIRIYQCIQAKYIYTMKLITKLLTIILVLSLTNCKDDKIQYDIDPTLKPYLESFLNKGRERGVNLTPEEDGLIMKFSNLKAPTIGLCTYSDPILVEIDKKYWEETSNYANKNDLRENVVFHELCHGLLNRGHTNTTLENSEWKSVMCGGDTYMERNWNINYSGYRKEYYLDELFNIRTSAPEWSKVFTFSGGKGEIYANMDLSQPYETIQNNISYNIENGELKILRNTENDTPQNIIQLEDEITGDFYYEVSFKCRQMYSEQLSGISVGYENKEGDMSYHYFYFNENNHYNDCRYYIAHSECYGPFAEVVKPRLQTSQFNHFAVQKKDGELFFYVNNELVYRNDYEVNNTFHHFGLIIPNRSLFTTNLVQISTLQSGGSTKSSTMRKIPTTSTYIVPIEPRFVSIKENSIY